MDGAGPEPNKPHWDSVRNEFESKFCAVPERKSLTDFIKTNKEIITIIGGFAALAVFFSANPINKPSLAFLSLLLVFILFLEFISHFFEEGNPASVSLYLFYTIFIIFLVDLFFSICSIYKDLILDNLFLGLFIVFWVTYVDLSIKNKVRKLSYRIFLFLIMFKPILNFISNKKILNLLQKKGTLPILLLIYGFFVIIACGILAYISSLLVFDIVKATLL
jgi:hypothetical protein